MYRRHSQVIISWCNFSAFLNIPLLPFFSSDNFDWPSHNELVTALTKHANQLQSDMRLTNKLWKISNKAIRTPDDSTDIQFQLWIIAHTGPSGYHGSKLTALIAYKHYSWSAITTDMQTFVTSCIHCLSKTGRERLSRSYACDFHETETNDLQQFNYIKIASS